LPKALATIPRQQIMAPEPNAAGFEKTDEGGRVLAKRSVECAQGLHDLLVTGLCGFMLVLVPGVVCFGILMRGGRGIAGFLVDRDFLFMPGDFLLVRLHARFVLCDGFACASQDGFSFLVVV